MTAILVRVAEAIRKELEGITLSQRVEKLERSYGDWEDLLEDNDKGLRIDVVPSTCQSSLYDRAKHGYVCEVSILLRRRFLAHENKNGRIDKTLIDQLVEDLQKVHEFFAPSQPTRTGLKLTDVPEAKWQNESVIKAPYSRKLLKDPGQYSGWCSVVYLAPVTPS